VLGQETFAYYACEIASGNSVPNSLRKHDAVERVQPFGKHGRDLASVQFGAVEPDKIGLRQGVFGCTKQSITTCLVNVHGRTTSGSNILLANQVNAAALALVRPEHGHPGVERLLASGPA
jgi:hypothetical protein